jgi:hypothetical protein
MTRSVDVWNEVFNVLKDEVDSDHDWSALREMPDPLWDLWLTVRREVNIPMMHSLVEAREEIQND